jgi:TolB-like protein
VLPFDSQDGKPNDASRAASEYAVTYLTRKTSYRVVERGQFQKVAGEIALSQTGLLSEERLLETGRMLSATHLVLGTLTADGDSRQVAARVVSTETGLVVAAVAAQLGKQAMSEFVALALGERASPSSYAFRSLAVPGWGQFYSGHIGHGTVSMLGVLGATGALVWSALDYREKGDIVQQFVDHDESLVREGESPQDWVDRANDAVAARNDAATRTNIFIGVLAGVWALNIVDAAICGAIEARTVKDSYFSLVPHIDLRSCGLTLHISMRRAAGRAL